MLRILEKNISIDKSAKFSKSLDRSDLQMCWKNNIRLQNSFLKALWPSQRTLIQLTHKTTIKLITEKLPDAVLFWIIFT